MFQMKEAANQLAMRQYYHHAMTAAEALVFIGDHGHITWTGARYMAVVGETSRSVSKHAMTSLIRQKLVRLKAPGELPVYWIKVKS